jgi:hypothetical protein
MRPTPKCVLDRSRPCTACIAPNPQSCPYPYLLADEPFPAATEQDRDPHTRSPGGTYRDVPGTSF